MGLGANDVSRLMQFRGVVASLLYVGETLERQTGIGGDAELCPRSPQDFRRKLVSTGLFRRFDGARDCLKRLSTGCLSASVAICFEGQ